jgi:OOP family OmpA-OmpF porin
MNKITFSLLAGLSLATVAPAAFADAQAGQGYVSAMATFADDDKDRAVDDGVAGGQLGLGWAMSDHWNLEGYASFLSLDGPAAQEHIDIGADLQLVFARESRITPYLFVGIGYMEVNPEAGKTVSGEALSGGAGLMLDIFGKSPVAVRAEYRYRGDNALGTTMNDQLFSLGLQIPFGGKKPVPVPVVVEPDTDGDGVKDSRDNCPGTPTGITVDSNGCPLDSDGDGVPDHIDTCPGTMRGVKVDANGCEIDSDRDGVFDRNDKCPNTRQGAQVDISGCEIMEEIRLPGVHFESNSDRLAGDDRSVLVDAAATLKLNPTIRVEVAGHTDSDGTADYNEGLSMRRATTVRDFLIAQGVSPARFTARGYGETQPIADNSTAAGKAENRRVSLRITAR